MSVDAPSTQELTLRCLIHDLDNVFQTFLDASELLDTDPKWRTLAAAIQRSTERGQRLVRSITEVSSATIPFATIAEIAVQSARDFIQATHRSAMEFQVEVSPHVRLSGNPAEWERALVNLLINSAQAIPRNGRVELTAHQESEGITIRIGDNGPGIADEILPRLFEPHVSTKRRKSGLGLHIVRSIVEAHGGTVTAANRPEGGAEFVICLPTCQPVSL
jgi:signal transduction histidine kinase